jgi:IclR family KDG regulon transcriptional repressor
MSKQEKNPNQRNYSIITGRSTADSTSLRRATDILNCLSNDINTITDISGYLGYSTSTVHRLLHNLNTLGWVIQDKNNHKYYLGPMVNQLSSNQIAAHKYLIMHAVREMTHLSTITGETVSLAIMFKLHHMLLHEISSKYELKITEESKMLNPVYIGATAKMLLSQLADKEIKAILKHVKDDRNIGKCANNQSGLMAQIEEIRQQGYCVTFGERIPGALCISTPINNYICPATLNILGPEDRLKPNVRNYIKELQTSTGRVSDDIAGVYD